MNPRTASRYLYILPNLHVKTLKDKVILDAGFTEEEFREHINSQPYSLSEISADVAAFCALLRHDTPDIFMESIAGNTSLSDLADQYTNTHDSVLREKFITEAYRIIKRHCEELTCTIPATLPPSLQTEENAPVILMRTPNHDYEIHHGLFADCVKRQFQWETLMRSLIKAGAKINIVPDTTTSTVFHRAHEFTRDPLIVTPAHQIILTDMSKRLDAEQLGIIAHVCSNNLNTPPAARMRDQFITSIITCEGGDVVFDEINKRIFMGHANNDSSAERNRTLLENATGYHTIAIPRINKKFFHLDTFLGVLPRGEVLFYDGATNESGKKALMQAIGPETPVIHLDKQQAKEMLSNVVAINNTIILAKHDKNLEESIQKLGYATLTPADVGLPTEFSWKIVNGGPRCLTSFPLGSAGFRR